MKNDISIIICTYNRYVSLNNTLRSLLKIHKPEQCSYNIVVVDNNSTDDTKAIVENIQSISPVEIKYIFEKQQGLSNARNRGLSESECHILCFIDDDVKVNKDWLVEIKKGFDIYDPSCLSGKVLLPQKLNTPIWWSESYNGVLGEFDIGDDVKQKSSSQDGLIGIGANMSFKRDVFAKYGLFRTDLGRKGSKLLMGEETEFVERLVRNGEKVIYYPGAIVNHYTDINRITKQYLRRHYYRIGEWCFIEARIKKCDYRIQKWMLRSIVENYFKSKFFSLQWKKDKSFLLELQAIQIFGFVSGAIKYHLNHKHD